MKVTMLLADGAHVVAGKLYVWGGGWSITGAGQVPMAVAMRFEIPWDQAERSHDWELELVDGDGRPVLCAAHNEHPIRHHGHLHPHRPPGLPPGVPVDVPVVVEAGNVAVAPDSRYVWRLTVDGEPNEAWQVAFTSRPLEEAATEGPGEF